MIPSLIARVRHLRSQSQLGAVMHSLADVYGDRLAVVTPEADLTFSALRDRVERFGAALETVHGVQPADRVVLATPNGIDQFLLCVAASRIGAIAVPINPQLRPHELDYVVADAGASTVVRDPEALLAESPDHGCTWHHCDWFSTAALFYTSGTTGMPKGVALSHRSLIGQSRAAVLWPLVERDDEVVMALPIAHIMGFIAVLGALSAGVRAVVFPRFDATQVLDTLEHRGSSAFVGVPAMYRRMLEAGAEDRNLRSVRLWVSGADAMPAELAERFRSFGASACIPVLGNRGRALFVEGYGMVEIGGGAATKVRGSLIPIPAVEEIGFRMPGYSFRAVNESGSVLPLGQMGELQLRGPGVLNEYWGAPEATRAAFTDDGWLKTGDLVRLGPFGSMVFCGRSKQVIKSGGFSVYPLEVELAIGEIPGVREASVVGLPDDTLGERVVAAIRVAPRRRIDEQSVLAILRDNLAHYKCPRAVVVVDDLPRTATQKVDKSAVRRLLAEALEA